MLGCVLAEEIFGDLEEFRLKQVAIEVKSQHNMNGLRDELTMLHFVFISVHLDQFDNTIHQLLAHAFVHLAFDGLQANLPERGAFGADEIRSLQHEKYVAESLHSHAERDPELFEEVKKVNSLLELGGLVTHLNETSVDDILYLVFHSITQRLRFPHLAEFGYVSESGLFRDILVSTICVKDF